MTPRRRASDSTTPIPKKRRRVDDEGHQLTLKRRLYTFLNGGRSTDVDLLVKDKDNVKQVPAHKNILVAMSSVMAAQLNRELDLEEVAQERHVVEIPSVVGVGAVEMFLKFLYNEELIDDLSVELWLELIFLADRYKVEDLKILCDWKLINKLNLGDCIKIYEKSRLIQDVKWGETSFHFIKKHLGEILISFSKEMDARTWATILGLNYLKNVEEIELFKALKGWKEENVEGRASDFRELVKLIRFPLIGVENFLKFVVPSQIFDMDLTLQMLTYFAGKGPIPEQFKDCQPRNLLEAKDSEELVKFIDEAQNGDVIELNGIYSPFIIPESKTNLTIRKKKGGKAIIKLMEIDWFWSVIAMKESGESAKPRTIGISIYGQQCKVDGISIIFDPSNDYEFHGIYLKQSANQTVLQNITISGCHIGVHIYGDENSISNIIVVNPRKPRTKFCEYSENNKIPNSGFIVEGVGNKLSILMTKNTKNVIGSKSNVINGFIISGKSPNFGLIVKGEDHHLKNVRIAGEDSTDSTLYLASSTKNISFDKCQSDKIIIWGNSHKLKGLKTKEIQIAGKGHKFKDCEADLIKLDIDAEIQSTGCDFKLIKTLSS